MIGLTPELAFAFEAWITLSKTHEVSETTYGKREIIPITGGSFEGTNMKGRILPGSADFQLIRRDGVAELEAKYALQPENGTLIYIINKGLWHGPEEVMQPLSSWRRSRLFRLLFLLIAVLV